jgi:outer membrane protein assembly factor BamD
MHLTLEGWCSYGYNGAYFTDLMRISMFTRVSGTKKLAYIMAVIGISLIVGCAGNGKKNADTEAAYYDAAQSYLEKRNYSLAIERLSDLQSRFPFGRYSKASTLDLIYAYYQSNDFTSALIEADRFARLNSDHADIDYALFVRAMSYYELYLTNRGIFGKGDPAMRSPEQGEKAFQALSNYVTRYPQSEYRSEALKAMVVLKDALARHELIVADYYIRRGAWIAAAERAQVIVSHYPGVSVVGDAYVVLVEAYSALELDSDRTDALNKLTTQFPNHESLVSGEYKSPKWEEDRWWVKVITLGLSS